MRKLLGFKGAAAVIGVVALAAMTVAVAIADVPVADGDGVAPVADNNMAMGNVNCGVASNKTALIAIRRNGAAGSTNVFKDGSTVTVSVLSVSGSGLSASVPNDPNNKITLPGDWGARANNTLSQTVSSTVTLNSSTPGAGSGTVTYRATGINSSGSTITRDDQMQVSWNTGTCDTTAPVITANVQGTLGDNGWYTSNVDVSFAVVDNESDISSKSPGCDGGSVTSDTTGTTFTCTATSAGGTGSKSVTIKRDATTPTIDGQASPGPNSDGWNNTDVDVTFACDDATSGIASCGPDKTLTGEGRNQSVTGGAKDHAGNTASDAISGVNIDKHGPTAPTASFDKPKAYTDSNGVDWFKDSVIVSYGGSTDPDLTNGDPGSGVKSYSAPETLSSSGTLNYSGKATDRADNDSSATSGTVKVDADNPSLQVTGCPSAALILGSSQSLSVTASDGESGLKTDPSGSVPLDTSSVGSKTKTVEAEDNVGHKVSHSCTYSVEYTFVGFSSPVDNGGVLNSAKAGQAIPLKWRLLDANNNPVTSLSSVTVTVATLSCSLGTTVDALEEYAAGSSGLQNLGNGYYQFNWKSPSTYANSCKTLKLDLGEGTPRTAVFKFTK
jgi:hypothetical protein